MLRSSTFWIDALERSLSTGAATIVALVSANGVDVGPSANFVEMLAAGGMAAVVSFLKVVAATPGPLGNPDGAHVRVPKVGPDDDLLD
ncbi:MAG: holin [Ilumatobacteraceae bacterium]